jgi:hypothetical protein
MLGKLLALGAGVFGAVYVVPKLVAKVKGTPTVTSSSTAGDVSSISPTPASPASDSSPGTPGVPGPGTQIGSFNEATGLDTNSLGDPNVQTGGGDVGDTSTLDEIGSLAGDVVEANSLVELAGL